MRKEEKTYRWLMMRGEKEKILKSKSVYLEQWLSIEISKGGGVKFVYSHYMCRIILG